MDLVVTLLTGRRPDLATRTLDALDRHAPGLLERARFVVLHNGSDEETAVALDEWRDRADEWHRTGALLPIGPATGYLARRVTASGASRWLHLEDDWQALGRSDDWLERAGAILDAHPEVAQVRLRDDRERVLARHMTEGHPLEWRDLDGYRLSPDAHATHNPALWRADLAAVAYPADQERTMQRNLRRAGWRASAQIVPGEFRHLGDRDAGLSLKWSLADERRR